ncbi:response regulator [bacterium]|nr:response regulator [bacterium]
MQRTILIVDDEEIIRNVLKRKLEQSTDFIVHTAGDGLPALEIFERENVDLVISDLMMSEMNGIELLRNLKRLKPSIPVIIITGYGTLDDAIEAIHLGAEDFIKKPFDINDVIETIEKTFRKLAEEADQREIIRFIEDENIKLAIPSDFEFLNTVINYVFSHLKARWMVNDENLHDVKVCMYEALTNAFEHGNLGIPGDEKSRLLEISQQAWRDFLMERMNDPGNNDKQIEVNLQISDQRMSLRVRDQGGGFDFDNHFKDVEPELLFRSSGRGLLLIRSLMDEMWFEDGGRALVMVKHRASTGGG